MIDASERAAQMLKNHLVRKCFDVGLGFRVAKIGLESGQTAFGIKIDYEKPGDMVITAHGIKVFMDTTAAALLGNCELDYVGESSGCFCFKDRSRNPVAGSKSLGQNHIFSKL